MSTEAEPLITAETRMAVGSYARSLGLNFLRVRTWMTISLILTLLLFCIRIIVFQIFGWETTDTFPFFVDLYVTLFTIAFTALCFIFLGTKKTEMGDDKGMISKESYRTLSMWAVWVLVIKYLIIGVLFCWVWVQYIIVWFNCDKTDATAFVFFGTCTTTGDSPTVVAFIVAFFTTIVEALKEIVMLVIIVAFYFLNKDALYEWEMIVGNNTRDGRRRFLRYLKKHPRIARKSGADSDDLKRLLHVTNLHRGEKKKKRRRGTEEEHMDE